jgi:uncharacterized YkwD family protein
LLRKWTSILSFVLFITIFFMPFSSAADASTVRHTYQLTSSGWQRVSVTIQTTAQALTQYVYFRVQPGDTLFRISRRSNTTVTELMRMNRLNGTTIHTNQLLLVPHAVEVRLAPKSAPKPELAPQPAPKPEPVPEPAPKPEPVPEPATHQLSQFEQRVLELTNLERQRYGLKPLQMDLELSKVARLKSQDLHDNRYFAHNSPTYGSPFDMMKRFGITYRTAGENIAGGQATPEAVVQGWMNSAGHRANILNAAFTHIGIGYFNGPNGYRHFWTQMFIGL